MGEKLEVKANTSETSDGIFTGGILVRYANCMTGSVLKGVNTPNIRSFKVRIFTVRRYCTVVFASAGLVMLSPILACCLSGKLSLSLSFSGFFCKVPNTWKMLWFSCQGSKATFHQGKAQLPYLVSYLLTANSTHGRSRMLSLTSKQTQALVRHRRGKVSFLSRLSPLSI